MPNRTRGLLETLRPMEPFLTDEATSALCEWQPPGGFASKGSAHGSPVAGVSCMELAGILRKNSSRPNRTSYGSCAVVGSSGGLIGSALGREIDAHNAVFRINHASVFRFERDVGSRVTFRVMTHYQWRIAMRGMRPSLLRKGVLPILYCHNPWFGKCFQDALVVQRWMLGRRPMITNPRLAGTVMRLAESAKRRKVPTTGMVSVALALNMCDNVTVYGFSDGSNRTACAYYHDGCRLREGEYFRASGPSHDFAQQIRLLTSLADRCTITWKRDAAASRPCATEQVGIREVRPR
jgi:hypothetical protein